MACDYCTDPDGLPCFPMYGQGPRRHEQGPVSGRAIPLPSSEWPDNYLEDPEWPGMGTWWCPHCGDGKPQEDTPSKPLQSPFQAPSEGVKEDTQHPSMGVEITNA